MNIEKTIKLIKQTYSKNGLEEVQVETLMKMKSTLLSIQKDKSELACKAIKLSTKLIKKLLEDIEMGIKVRKQRVSIKKLNLFFRVIRNVIETAKREEEESLSTQEQAFFSM